METSEVIIQADNPYHARFPDRRTVSREGLVLVKHLRRRGIGVRITPDNGKPVEYIARKGFSEFLQDPLVIFVTGIAKDLIVAIVGAWVYDLLKSRKASSEMPESTNIAIVMDEDGKRVIYDHQGKEISDARFKEILALMEQRRRDFSATFEQRSSDPSCPYPIRLEHTAKIVGWANIIHTDTGLEVRPAVIHDADTQKKLQAGQLKGFSIAVIVVDSECSICKKSFVECNHGADKSDEKAICTIKKLDLCEISLVGEPVNPACKAEPSSGDEDV